MKSIQRAMAWLTIAGVLAQPGFGNAGQSVRASAPTVSVSYTSLGLRGPQTAPEPMTVVSATQPPAQLAARPSTPLRRQRAAAPQPASVTIKPEPTDILVTNETALSVEVQQPIAQEMQLVSSDSIIDTTVTISQGVEPAAGISVETPSAEAIAVDTSANAEIQIMPTVQVADLVIIEPQTITAPQARVMAPVEEPEEPAVAPQRAVPTTPPAPPLPPIVTRNETPAPATRALTPSAPLAAAQLPYQNALRCIANNLGEQRRDSYTVGQVTNDAAQFAINGPEATGSIGPINGAPIFRMALFQGGVTVVRTDPQFRDIYGFQLDQGVRGELGDGQVRNYSDPATGVTRQTMTIPHVAGRLSPAEYLVEGSIVSIDNDGGQVFEGGISGARAGTRTTHLTILMVVTVTRMPLGPTVGGEVIDSFPLIIELSGRETRLGVMEILGGTPLAVSLDYRRMNRQSLQYLTQVGWQGGAFLVLMRHYGGDQPGSPLASCNQYLPFPTVAQ